MSQLSVDLHAHIFIKKGTGWLFRTNEGFPLTFKSRYNRLVLKTNTETINNSGIGLLVVALYAYPLLVLSVKKSIREQIKNAEEFVKKNDKWIIAKSPDEAYKAYLNGKKIMVLSLEGVDGILDSQGDIAEFFKLGIRIVTPLHLSNDILGGSAFLGGWKDVFFNPLEYAKSLFRPEYHNGIKINSKGLTPKGKNIVELLIKQKIWVDLSHASHKSYNDISKLLIKAGQPLLFSHALPQEFRFVEAGITDKQLEDVRKSKGIIGLAPVKDFLDLSKNEYQNKCDTFEKFRLAYIKVSQTIGINATVFGTDFNGGVIHLPDPSLMKIGTEIDMSGFWNIGQEKDLWQALEKSGVKISNPRSNSIEYFINTWKKVWH
jgi:microsomal dipeptidase-like Zn-dependent dipeptidase